MINNQEIARVPFVLFAVIGMSVLYSAPAYAHCEGMDGPVVKANTRASSVASFDPMQEKGEGFCCLLL